MATEDKKKGEEEEAAPPPKSKKKLIIIIVVAVVVIAAGVVGVLFAGGKKGGGGEGSGEEASSEDSGDGEAEGEGEEEHGELPGAIVALDTFIVNLQVKGSFLKTTIQLQFVEPEQPKTLDNDLPKIRDAIIRILSSKAAQDILSPEGKEKLREEVKEGINSAMGSEDVSQIYFTEFIVQ